MTKKQDEQDELGMYIFNITNPDNHVYLIKNGLFHLCQKSNGNLILHQYRNESLLNFCRRCLKLLDNVKRGFLPEDGHEPGLFDDFPQGHMIFRENSDLVMYDSTWQCILHQNEDEPNCYFLERCEEYGRELKANQ